MQAMSNFDPGSPQPLKCSAVRFVEVEFPRQLRPRLVVEFSDGLSLLLEDRDAVPLAADLIAAFRSRLAAKEGSQC
jgi:hypothetical protein